MTAPDTIVAVATGGGGAGVGIVRLSGPESPRIARALCGRALRPRHAHHARFRDAEGDTLDDGIALLFAAPASYTGEDVVELQAHGNDALLQALVARCVALGARPARPGEFTERAFLNGRFDLAQAEAVADLVAAADLRAARAARRSLDGVFSQRVDALADALLALRVQVEAGIDFADEPIDAAGDAAIAAGIDAARDALATLRREAERGRRLRDGLHVVLAGPPNAGKSSLLNALAGEARAIVTDVPGTTRDLLREAVRIDGIEITLVDTAGLRDATDAIEREGIRRARDELARADLALLVLDARAPGEGLGEAESAIAGVPRRLRLLNKFDLLADADLPSAPVPAPDAVTGPVATPATEAGAPVPGTVDPPDVLHVSARTGDGLDALRARLRAEAGGGETADGAFSARARHLDALARVAAELDAAAAAQAAGAPELAAESLRLAHDALGGITGRVAPDDLLGHIFTSFCIGK